MKRTSFFTLVFLGLLTICQVKGQLPPVFNSEMHPEIRETALTRKAFSPVAVIWTTDDTGEYVRNAKSILNTGNGQADLNRGKYLTLINNDTVQSGILLDFGKEIQGGIELVTTISNRKPAGKVRIRFGESVAEAMSEIQENGATNDHAMRDFEIMLPWLGRIDIGQTGFRFVRVDLVEPNGRLELKEINAAFIYRDIPYLGSFRSNDKRLNDIWLTGAYTVHLNMQDYLWDGIKRDRLVWVGDLHPEVMTVNSVFGYNEVVPRSLDLARDLTPLPGWMNGISSYSMWWIILHRDWYKYQGDLEYLKEQKDYLAALLGHLASKIDDSGKEVLDGNRFLDWPSSKDPDAVHAGLQSMMVMTFDAGLELSRILGDREMGELCGKALEKLKKHIPDTTDSKQAAALLALSGLVSPLKANAEVLSQDGAKRMSTFYGYYMLQARALAGDVQGALDNIREYWGGMLDLGATTFWEDFNIEWMENAARIDEVVPEGKIDVHGMYGDYCYVSYRHSLCHGWASGPTAWLTEHVLGVKVLEPGGKRIKIEPALGDLEWVEGTFPTRAGVVEIKHRKKAGGGVITSVVAPDDVIVAGPVNGGENSSFIQLPRRGLCAHRGAMETHPENTIPAFQEAIKAGAHMIEFDVQLTKDNKLVVIHDASVDRTTNGKGKVSEMTFSELKKLDAGSWKAPHFAGLKIPSFQEVLNEMPVNIWLNIHIKGDDSAAKLIAEIVRKENRLHQAVLACNSSAAEMARMAVPEVMICNMDRKKSHLDYIDGTKRMNAGFIQLNGKIIPEFSDYAKSLKKNGIKINYFGTDSPSELIQLFDYGIDFPLVNDIIHSVKIVGEIGIEPVQPIYLYSKY